MGIVTVADINWNAWTRQAPLRERLWLAEVRPDDGATGEEAFLALWSKALSLEANERRALLFSLVAEIAAAVLGIAQSRIDASSTLGELGADSIMAAEISQAVFARIGVRLRTLNERPPSS